MAAEFVNNRVPGARVTPYPFLIRGVKSEDLQLRKHYFRTVYQLGFLYSQADILKRFRIMMETFIEVRDIVYCSVILA